MPLLRTEREGRVLTVVLDDPPANFMTVVAPVPLLEPLPSGS